MSAAANRKEPIRMKYDDYDGRVVWRDSLEDGVHVFLFQWVRETCSSRGAP